MIHVPCLSIYKDQNVKVNAIIITTMMNHVSADLARIQIAIDARETLKNALNAKHLLFFMMEIVFQYVQKEHMRRMDIAKNVPLDV